MLALFSFMLAILIILVIAEVLWRRKILRGENQRKFVHISIFTLTAFMPWFISWQSIQIIAVLMLLADLTNRHLKKLHYLGDVKRIDYGDILMPLAIIACTLMTTNKIFFALAILQVSLADGFAAVIGERYGKYWQYKILRQKKTVIGTMAFWFVSLCIIGFGILAPHILSFPIYALLIIFLPPLLTLIENISVFGFDNLTLPIATLLIIKLAYQM
jgi:dolichol kinase